MVSPFYSFCKGFYYRPCPAIMHGTQSRAKNVATVRMRRMAYELPQIPLTLRLPHIFAGVLPD